MGKRGLAACLVLGASVAVVACGTSDTARKDAGGTVPLHDAGRAPDAAQANDASMRGDSGHATQHADAAMEGGGAHDSGPSHDAATDAGPSSPRDVCKPGAVYGAPLSSNALTAMKIDDSFAFSEGPVWLAQQGVLLFSDISPGTGAQNVQPAQIRRLTPPSSFDVWLDPSGSNGMALSADGKKLIACTHDLQNVSSYDLASKQRSTVAASYMSKSFHSPNDVTVRSDGTVYFTDPNFQQGNRNTNITDKTRVYRVAPNGDVSVVDETIDNPNGIALSPDEKTLYVDGSGSVWKYTVHADGSTGAPQPFASGLDAPDGMTIDCAGNLYVAEFNTGKVHVYSPSGTELGTIAASTHTTNMAFGGADAKTLFITSGGAGNGYGVYSIVLGVPGLPY